MRAGWTAIFGLASVLACGGPETIDPGPTQSVQDDFAGRTTVARFTFTWTSFSTSGTSL